MDKNQRIQAIDFVKSVGKKAGDGIDYVGGMIPNIDLKNYEKYFTFNALNDKRILILGMFSINFVLLWAVGITSMSNISRIKFFNYPTTSRLLTPMPSSTADYITSIYTGWGIEIQGLPSDNMTYPLNREGRVALRKAVFDSAGCYAVTSASGSQDWDAEEVSPVCNCLNNMLIEFALSHVGNDPSRLPEIDTMNRGKLKTMTRTADNDKMASVISQTCFSGVRSTQFETMGDATDFMAVNIILGTIVWNTVSTACWLYVAWQSNTDTEVDGVKIKNDKSSMQWIWRLRDDTNDPKLKASKFFNVYFIIMIFLIHIPLFVSVFGAGTGWDIAIDVFIPVLYFCGLILSQTIYHKAEYKDKISWQFRKSLVFWASYAISISYLIGSFNSLSQRRDSMYNANTEILCICITGLALGADYMRSCSESLFSSGSLETFGSKIFDYRESIINSYSEYSKYLWCCNLLVVFIIISLPGTGFEPGPFSNVHSVSGVCLVLQLMIPIMGHAETEIPASTTTNMEKYNKGNDAFLFRGGIDTISRFIFSLAVIADLVSTNYADNVYL